jgi:phosphoadenosine phosphosulfate reductase
VSRAAIRQNPLARPIDVAALNAEFRGIPAVARMARALEELPGAHVLSSSFGAQAAVSLHLATRALPRMPVILIDTGYLFAETYRFVEQLSERLDLNLKVYRPEQSSAWLEARHGQLWTQGAAGIERYNQIHKVEPMQRALDELGVGTWYAGLRRRQSRSRASIEPVQAIGPERYKVHPIFDWTDRDVYDYLRKHDLPYHPLWESGYVSIGDWHTTRPLHETDDVFEATRFFGLQRECGLHLIGTEPDG